MKNIKTLTQVSIALPLALIISACDGSKDKKPVDESINFSIEDTIVIQTCSDVSDDANTEILSGDRLTSQDANTTVKLTYNEDGSNYVCVLNGGAFIKR